MRTGACGTWGAGVQRGGQPWTTQRLRALSSCMATPGEEPQGRGPVPRPSPSRPPHFPDPGWGRGGGSRTWRRVARALAAQAPPVGDAALEPSGHVTPPGRRTDAARPDCQDWPGLDTSVPRLAAPCVPGGRCGLADRSPDRRLAPRCLPTPPGVLPRAGWLSGDRRSRQLPREAQGPWAAAARPSTEGSPCPADTDSPEPPRVAGRGHPDILLPVPGLRRTHRLCQLQLTQVGLDGGGPLPAGAPAASPCSAGMEAT